jgi:glycosyltransferase involved in cell wall biosynthesis
MTPWLSVKIPVWNPRPEYLATAVRSVLDLSGQDSGIEIEIVDDCSPNFDPVCFATAFPPGSISVHRNTRRLGIAGNWNVCVSRARGRWIHLLHQDDFLLPGFYTALRHGMDDPMVGAAFCASYFTDASGAGWAPRLIPATEAGILDHWEKHVFIRLSIQCSAIVVRRDVYEAVGSFDTGFRYALDWDMWKRIAVRYPIWFHPEPLAGYRMHSESETSRQIRDGSHLAEIFRSIEHSATLLPAKCAGSITRRARSSYAEFAAEAAFDLIRSDRAWNAALLNLRVARKGSSMSAMIAGTLKALMRRPLRRRNLKPLLPPRESA